MAEETGGIRCGGVPMAIGVQTDMAPRLDKLGMRSSDTAQVTLEYDTAQVTLEDVRVPAANVIGEPGRGFAYKMLQFQEERLFAAANVLLPLQRCLGDTAANCCRERHAFGKPLLANQTTVRFRLAVLETELELLRSLVVWRAANVMEAGEDVTKLASIAKLKAGRLSREVTDSCLQYWGGVGFMGETEVSRAYRDLRLISIGGGADEVMLEIISKLTHGKSPQIDIDDPR
jgi:citronellyl-CoA dehydrogenase